MIFVGKLLKNIPQESKNKTVPTYYALSWLLISWWPHDNFHIHNGMNAQGLLYIEYGFHLTLLIASLILANYFIHIIKAYKNIKK